jgi:hypothetical protein
MFLLDAFLRREGFMAALDAIGCRDQDTLRAMLGYYILRGTAMGLAGDWQAGSYARILYPRANLASQRIGGFLADMGEEGRSRGFFSGHIPCLGRQVSKGTDILIGSSWSPDGIRFPLTAVGNHGGEIGGEAHLIYVVHLETGLPVYFRYSPGNAIDAPTLIRTVLELGESGVNTRLAIMDAGYHGQDDIAALYQSKVSFVCRLRGNLKLYRSLTARYLDEIERKENIVSHDQRHAYVQRVPCELIPGQDAYAYVGLDIDRNAPEPRKPFGRARGEKPGNGEVFDRMTARGAFVLVSSGAIARDKILPAYHMSQKIERIFDIGKNYADMLPPGVQSEDTFRGHLLMAFIASAVVKKLQDKLKDTPYDPNSMFSILRNQKCKIYGYRVIPQEALGKANDVYRLFKIACPVDMPRP